MYYLQLVTWCMQWDIRFQIFGSIVFFNNYKITICCGKTKGGIDHPHNVSLINKLASSRSGKTDLSIGCERHRGRRNGKEELWSRLQVTFEKNY